MLGVVVGFGFVGAGHWSRSKDWQAFSSAMSGGGIAILYLSTLAALVRYELIDPATGLVDESQGGDPYRCVVPFEAYPQSTSPEAWLASVRASSGVMESGIT